MYDFVPIFIKRVPGSEAWELICWNDDTGSYYVAGTYENEAAAKRMLAARGYGIQMSETIYGHQA